MALETLKDVTEIDGFKIVRTKPIDMTWEDFDKLRNSFPINITDRMNCISFKMQDGPVKENGINGCQLTTLIDTAKIMLINLNTKFPCRENAITITKLEEALMWQDKRTQDREKRNVEGESKL